ncbi:Ankyrin repeat-containing domain superfamily [Fusarium oxysporum f. sp. vasinfectum]|nr:Ankyrin repeat-containing domain superfamily [Fusarium oxysporum f. sp. vasinfectum]
MNHHSSVQAQSTLHRLPPKVLFEILGFMGDYSDKMNLSRTCRQLYDMLILEAYSDAGKQLNWRHMFEAAEDGNCRTLAKCLQAGAPIEYRDPEDCARPLQIAIAFCRPLTVKWLLEHGASPNYMGGDEEAVEEALCPLAVAIDLAIRPGIAWEIPFRWQVKDIKVPSVKRLAHNAREIIKILRQAGANEQPLDDHVRGHLDSIEAGISCCPQHNSRLWRRRG